MDSQHAGRGFSLIEAAIVLGVVGIVIGGIWVAASTVMEKLKWQRTEAGWAYYLIAARKVYNFQNIANCGLQCGGNNTNNISSYAETLPVPAGWTGKRYGSGAETFRPTDPYGNRLYLAIDNSHLGIDMSYAWAVVDKKTCAKIKHMMVTRLQKIAKITYTGWAGGCPALLSNPNASTVDYYYNNCCLGTAGEVRAVFDLPNR